MKENTLVTDTRGRVSEGFIHNALIQLCMENGPLNWFIPTTPYGRNDLNGVDVFLKVVTKTQHVFIPLQIKSSGFGQKEHKDIFPDIPSINTKNGSLSYNAMKKRIMRIINAWSQGKILHV